MLRRPATCVCMLTVGLATHAGAATSASAAPSAGAGLNFAARPVKLGIQLSWRTGYLPKTLGWNVYRGKVKLNRALIFAAGGRAGAVTYAYVDRGPQRRSALYRLQAVSLAGRATWVAQARR